MSLLDKAWEQIQERTFTRWVNAQLKKKGVQIQDLTKDFADGVNLIALYESIADMSFPRYNKNPSMRIKKIENINLVVTEINKFVAGVGIKVKFSAEQVADCDRRIILGMVWVLIHKFAIQEISEEEMHARDGLLLWCKKKTDGYKNVKVDNFHTSWKSGLAFCALIHKHYPNLINYDSLDPNDHAKNLQLAFDVAEKDLDIPQLLDVNDIVSQEKPDEKSIMAYVAYYWKKFASTGKQQKAANMISRLGKKDAEYAKIAHDYEERAKKLVSWIAEKDKQYSDCSNLGNSLAKVQAVDKGLREFKNVEKPKQNEERADLEITLKNLRAKQKNDGLKVYEPPQDLTIESINGLWEHLSLTQKSYEAAVREAILKMKLLEQHLEKFNVRSKQYQQWHKGKSETILAEDVSKVSSIPACQNKIKSMESFHEEFEGQKKGFVETERIGGEVINGGHEAASVVQETCKDCTDATAKTEQLSAELKEKLDKRLKHLQTVESKQLEFANLVQGLQLNLDDSSKSLLETVASTSVEEIDSKINAHKAVLAKHIENKGKLEALAVLNREVSEMGDNASKFSSTTYEDIEGMYNSVTEELQKRTGELDKEKELQELHVKMLQDWDAAAKAYLQFCEEQKELIMKEDEGSYLKQLEALKQKGSKSIAASQEQLSKLSNLYEGLVSADIADRVETSLQNLQTVGHSSVENAFRKRSTELEQKNKALERIYGRFKSQVENIKVVQAKKKDFLDNILGKVSDISSLQSELNNIHAFPASMKGVADSIDDVSGMANEIISQKHDDSEAIQQSVDGLKQSSEQLEAQAKQVEEDLAKKLDLKQGIDGKCVQFAKLVQQLNLFVDDCHSQIQEPVGCSSLKEVELLQEKHQKLQQDYAQQSEVLGQLKSMQEEISKEAEQADVYSTMSLDQISQKYANTKEPMEKKKEALDQERQRQENNESLVKSYNTQFTDYTTFIDNSASAIQKDQEGELEEQLKTVKEMGTSFSNESQTKLKELTDLFSKIEAADIAEQVVSIHEASISSSKLQKTIAKRIEALESSILSKKQSNISEAQLKDFHDTFRHFDRDRSGYLTKLPFKACCAAVGEDIPDNKLEETFNSYDNDHDGKISFDEFITFISSVAKAGSGKEDILQAFRDLSGGNKYISEQQIRGNFDKEQAEQFLAQIPKTDEGYDYEAYCNNSFASQ